MALTSLMLQSRPADKINLWVSQEPYLKDEGIKNAELLERLLDSLPNVDKKTVAIRWVSNTGPYRKLIPALREAESSDVIVTADDDIFYGENWLSGLLAAFENSGGKPVASRVRAKKTNFLGLKTSYIYWDLIERAVVATSDYVVTFGGGAVVTKSMFRAQDIGDDNFLRLAPTADDLWYSKLLEINNNQVVVVPSVLNELNFVLHNDGLIKHNFPNVESVFNKSKALIWNNNLGFFGVPICGNDVAHRKIEKYFEDK